jgi:alpha-maltose-1-phosphate synthase
MKKRVAIVRGPNLSSWEMQNFSPLMDEFGFCAYTSYFNNFDLTTIPFEVKKLFSVGQFIKARILRKPMNKWMGDYHDLQGLGSVLNGYDIVHSVESYYYCSYQAACAKEKNNFKLVLTVWENIPYIYYSEVSMRNRLLMADRADLFLPTSERAKEVLILEGMPEEKIKVQMPGIDIKHFHPMDKDKEILSRFNCAEDDIIVLFVANLYREKGIYDLVYGFKRLIDRSVNKSKIKLLIAGRGKEKNNVASWIKRLNLGDNVQLIGSYNYSQMPIIHNIADIFILPSLPTPSWQEQFGYVLIESMASGKPIISTLSGSIPEVVGDAGILIQPNDFYSITSALEELINDSRKRTELGKKGRLRVEQIFDVNIVANSIRKHYNELLSR